MKLCDISRAPRPTTHVPPVDMRPHPNKFKGLRVLRFASRITSKHRPANCAPALMGSLDGSEGSAPMQWRASGRDTRCRRSRKATQDNSTSVDPERGRDATERRTLLTGRLARHGSPLGQQCRVYPARADGYRPFEAPGPPAFLLLKDRNAEVLNELKKN